MARWKEPASQGRRETVIDRVHWLWSLESVPIDLDPGPSVQWYPERWESDPDVGVMPWAVKAMHLHLIHVAFKDARPTGSISSEEEMRIQCGDPEDSEWTRIRRTLLRAWVERHGRIWQPGTCRAYLGAVVSRLRRTRAAGARWANDGDPAKQVRGKAMEKQCTALLDALQGSTDAMHAAEDALLLLRAGARSPSPSPSPINIEEEGTTYPAAAAAGEHACREQDLEPAGDGQNMRCRVCGDATFPLRDNYGMHAYGEEVVLDRIGFQPKPKWLEQEEVMTDGTRKDLETGLADSAVGPGVKPPAAGSGVPRTAGARRKEERLDEVTTGPVGKSPAPAGGRQKRKPSKHQMSLQRIADWFDEGEERELPVYKSTGSRNGRRWKKGDPQWGMFSQWLTAAGGDAGGVRRALDRCQRAGKLGNWGYFSTALEDWAKPPGRTSRTPQQQVDLATIELRNKRMRGEA